MGKLLRKSEASKPTNREFLPLRTSAFLMDAQLFLLTILGHLEGSVDERKDITEDFDDYNFASNTGDKLNLVLKAYLKGFGCGEKHVNDEDRIACIQRTKIALKQPRKIQSSIFLRDFLSHLLKGRVRIRKALQLQAKKRELFESGRKELKNDRTIQAATGMPPDGVTRTPWQQLLHKGAPGSQLTTEHRNHQNAQLVSLPLLKIVTKMNDDWKIAYRDIVHAVRSVLYPHSVISTNLLANRARGWAVLVH